MIITETQIKAEKTVLGHLLSSPDLVNVVFDAGFDVDHFVLPASREVWGAVKDLITSGQPCGAIQVASRLEATGKVDAVGGEFGIAELIGHATVRSYFDPSVQILQDLFRKRKIEVMASELLALCSDATTSSSDVLAEAEKRMPSLRDHCGIEKAVTIGDALGGVVDSLEWRCTHPGQVRGLTSGFSRLDRTLDGLQQGAMIVIAARPGIGKTAILVNILKNLALSDSAVPIGMFSLEMPKEQLLERIIFGMSHINASALRSGKQLSVQQQSYFRQAAAKMQRAPFFIDDRSALSVDQIQAKARRMVRDHGVRCIGVDYLQLAKSTSQQAKFSREREVSEISAGLKAIAKELKIPVIVLAQLNRDSEKRAGKSAGVPMVSDLRDSGSIEQDADQVILIHRPYVYDKEADPKDAKFIIGKNRFGEIGFINMTWDAHLTTFKEPEQGILPI